MTEKTNDRTVWRVAVIGALIAIAYALRILIPVGMDPSAMLALGEESPRQTAYAQMLLDAVTVREALGHDGKFFFAQANDPWYLDPGVHAAVLDRPAYRAQRMLYPSLAGGLGLFPPEIVVWAMIVVNLVAMGAGSLVTAKLAATLGATPWLGLAFPLNLGLLSELDIGGAGVLALLLGVSAVLAAEGERKGWTVILLTLGSLAREVMLLFALGIALLAWVTSKKLEWRMVAVPTAAVLSWGLYVRARVSGLPTSEEIVELAVPFTGIVGAARYWLQDARDLVIALVLLVLLVVFAARALRSRFRLAWAALPFIVLAVALSARVWREPYDITRAVAPVLTAYPLLLFCPGDRSALVATREHAFD